MTAHRTGAREDWLAARLELLEAEKELTRRSDALASTRSKPAPRSSAFFAMTSRFLTAAEHALNGHQSTCSAEHEPA
ncbi:uncharacterized protein SOCE26_074710 [Sorangium cellulosum]|uniref:Uncharacterized protein n=1 Tax=Sorangium cellulosum TaxID=56 RepID=A0A2L0F3D9_SORCE|nr:DUF899 family protein [Sorangium cellulosum]AUX45969.1 uncharacterized protein SOCE26_074710 [Sorangium cellulosum]